MTERPIARCDTEVVMASETKKLHYAPTTTARPSKNLNVEFQDKLSKRFSIHNWQSLQALLRFDPVLTCNFKWLLALSRTTSEKEDLRANFRRPVPCIFQ
jgi:hypothetical protein